MIKLNYKQLIHSNIIEWEQITNKFNEVLSQISLNDKSQIIFKNNDLVRNGFIYCSNGISRLDTARITQDALVKFYKMTLLNPELRKEYYECFSNYQNVSIETIDSAVDPGQYRGAAYHILQTQKDEVLELLFLYPNETITIYAKKINKKAAIDYDANNFFVNGIEEKLADHILGIIRRKISSEKITQYLELYKIGFSHITRMSLIHLELKTYNKILSSFRSLIYIILIASELEIKEHKMTGEDLLNLEIVKFILNEAKQVNPDINPKRIYSILPQKLKSVHKTSNSLSLKINEIFLSEEKFKRIEIDGKIRKVRVNVPVRYRTFGDLLNLWKDGKHSLTIVENFKNLLIEKVMDYLGIYELPQSALDIINNVGVVCGTQDNTEDNQVRPKFSNQESEFPFRIFDNQKT